MRALAVIDLILRERSADEKDKLGYPEAKDIILIFKHSRFAGVDARSMEGEELDAYYRTKAKPVFDTILNDEIHKHLREDINYLVFCGKVANGADIVVSKREEGQIKVRIWHANTGAMLTGVQKFFAELSDLERAAKQVRGYDGLFVAKTITVEVMERQETDSVLTGTTERLPWHRRLWLNNKSNILIAVGALALLVADIILVVALKGIKAEATSLYQVAYLGIPGLGALFLNYAAQVLRGLLHNTPRISWDISTLNKYHADS